MDGILRAEIKNILWGTCCHSLGRQVFFFFSDQPYGWSDFTGDCAPEPPINYEIKKKGIKGNERKTFIAGLCNE